MSDGFLGIECCEKTIVTLTEVGSQRSEEGNSAQAPVGTHGPATEIHAVKEARPRRWTPGRRPLAAISIGGLLAAQAAGE